ncbi:hypothetical protein [Sulfuracidifex tepidarius]|uniref:Uncharacterized protein n=1 Tax=Sulfuracidifex tepidarius TaxID=1294262 RepID=A0A510E161_9CREN|nr:hypothetical protein [Sulfuracidifex tepidarius]BBG23481.1 hypothetical protein IC006_0765 [Sulfuracidifex tepidarius]BBG26234.1 hypothetical protein IC007_0739 [Sulfuracidifex tepidarius]
MAYRCCDTDFNRKEDFFKHVKSNDLHFLTFSDRVDLNLSRDSVSKVISNPNLLFTASGKVSIVRKEGEDVIKTVIVRNDAGDRISFGRVKGPLFDGQLLTYLVKVNGNPAQYRISFRLMGRGDTTNVTILNRMEAKVGFLGKAMPWLVPKVVKGPASFADKLNEIMKASLAEMEILTPKKVHE